MNAGLGAGLITPSSPTIDSGQSVTLNPAPSGGTPSYHINWFSAAGCSAVNFLTQAPTYAASPGVTTTYSYNVVDSAATPAQACTASGDLVTVNGAQSAGLLTETNTVMVAGQVSRLTANPSGGTPSYTINWFSKAACAGASIGSGTSLLIGNVVTTTFSYNSVDSATTKNVVCSASNTVTVTSNQIAGPLIESNTVIDSGQVSLLTANPSGGTTPYTISYFSKAACAGLPIGSGATLLISNTVSTTFSYNSVDAEAVPNSVCSASNTVTVNPAPSLGVSPATAGIDNVQGVVITATPSGGSGTGWTYKWYNDAGCTSLIGGTASTNTLYPSSTTTYCIKATDSLSGSATGTSVITVYPTLGPVSVSNQGPFVYDVGQTATTISSALTSGGGNPGLAYQWYTAANSGCPYGTSTGVTTSTYPPSTGSSGGPTYYCIRATDNEGATVYSGAAATVTVNPALVVNPPTASNTILDSGQSTTLTSHASGGTPGLTINWFNAANCGGSYLASGTTYTANPGSTTTYSYNTVDSATTKNVLCSSSLTIIVNPAQGTGLLTESNTMINSGQISRLTANPIGGSSPYIINYFSQGSCLGGSIGTGASLVVNPVSTTTYSFNSVDSATTNSIVCSNSNTVNVNGALNAGPITPSTPTIDVGQQVTLNSAPSGGTPSYHINWFSAAGCSAVNFLTQAATYAASPGSSTTYSYNVVDSATTPSQACTASGDLVTVNPTLSAGLLTESNTAIDSGQATTLTSHASGGTPGLTINWFNAANCGGSYLASGTTYTTNPGGTTIYSYNVVDSATTKNVVCSASNTVTYAATPTVSLAPGSGTIDNGQNAAFTATASNGQGTYTYNWNLGSGLSINSGCTSGTNLCTVHGTNAGGSAITPQLSVSVTDSATTPVTSSASAVTVTVYPSLAISVSNQGPFSYDVGQTATTISSSVTSGASNPGFAYQWYTAANSGCPYGTSTGGTASTYTPSTASPGGPTYYCVRATDSEGSTVYSSAAATVTVYADPTANPLTMSPNPIDNSYTSVLTSHPVGGTGSFTTYAWYTGSCASSLGVSTATDTVGPSSNTIYSYKATDSNGYTTACSATNTLTVNPTLNAGAITPASPTIPACSGETLTAHPSGGSGSLSDIRLVHRR